MKATFTRWLLVILLLALFFGASFAHGADVMPGTIFPSLLWQIEQVLNQTHTPGAGIAIVRREGPELVTGLGLADVATKKPVTTDTLFRIGSTSKSFVSLSLLKLQREGKLKLSDTLKSRAPNLWFSNPWEQTDPVRLVHLLEHTSGWDDLWLRDYAFHPEQEVTLREGLALRPISRTSRWKAGTRYSYSNVGPAAAAYVVEQVTGERFEDYVQRNWFGPLGMTTASYFDSPEVQSRLTKLYQADGVTTIPYWKISTRPSGAINASTHEMANCVQFYLNRGAFGGVQLLPAEDIERMERATSTYAAHEGLGAGYGLGNYANLQDGWVFHGHSGAVGGGLAELAYLPDAGVGYVILLNSGSGKALGEIGKLIREHLTQNLPAPPKPPGFTVSAGVAQAYAGWYEFANPRAETLRFFTRLIGLSQFSFADGQLVWKPLNGKTHKFAAVSNRLFRREQDPVPTVALIADHADGTFIQMTGVTGATFRRVSGWEVLLELGTVTLGALLMLSTVVFSLVWLPRKICGRLRGVDHLSVRVLPLLAVASAAGCWLIYSRATGLTELLTRFGELTLWSLTLFFLTLVLPVFAVGGMVQALRCRREKINRLVWWHSFATSAVMTVVSLYLAYWGVIGIRTWI